MAYREIDPESFAVHNQQSQERKLGGDFQRYALKVAPAGTAPQRNRFRIMPPHENMVDADGRPDFCVTQKVHFSLGPASDTAINCLEFYGKDCPACTYVNTLTKNAKAEADPQVRKQQEEFARKKAAKIRFSANVVDMLAPEKGVQTFSFGVDLEKKLRGPFWDDNGQFRDITNPTSGRDVFIAAVKKPGTDFNDYPEVRAAEAPSPLKDMAWLDEIQDLTELAKEPTLLDVQNALKGIKRQRDGGATRPTAVTTAPEEAKAPAPAPAPRPAPAARAPKPAAPVGQPIQAPAATAPAPAATTEAVAPPARRPRSAAAEPVADAWGPAREFLAQYPAPAAGWVEIAPEDVAGAKKPECYNDAEPTDAQCIKCKLIYPCLMIKLGKMAA